MLRLPQFLHFTSLLLRREPCTACFNFSGGMFAHGRRQVTMLVGAMSEIKSDIFFLLLCQLFLGIKVKQNLVSVTESQILFREGLGRMCFDNVAGKL